MGRIAINNFGKGGSTSKSASPDGLSMENRIGAPKGVNPNKGYPGNANMSGDRGGSPGAGQSGNGQFRGAKGVAGVHMGQPGSGHVMSESKRSNTPGYTAMGKSAPDMKVQTYGKKR